MEETKRGALALKLARILGEIGKVEKSGRNEFHKYDYVTENDLVYAVRSKLAAEHVFVFTSTEGQHVEIIEGGDGKKWCLTTVTTRHTFVDGDSGEEFSVLSQGQGADNGDKGGYKAITGAMKYFLYKCFMIPTGDDPEADPKTDERAAAGPAKSTPARTTTESRAPAAGASKPSPSVPRETSTQSEREEFEDGRWQEVKIHFGNNYKGMKLGELTPKQLTAWFEWQPKPYNGKISADDKRLRTALDVAHAEQGQQ